MKRAWRAWVQLLSTREPATTLAWFRIALGLVMLYSVTSVMTAGLVEVMWVDAAYGGLQTLDTPHWLLSLLGPRTPTIAWTLGIASLVLATMVAAGLGGRVTMFVALQVYSATVDVKFTLTGGYDAMMIDALWLLVLADSTATLSLDCRRRTGRWRSDRLVAAWPRYLLIFQLLVVYGTTGWHKLSPVWTPGGAHSALYWVFQDPTWRRFDMAWTAHLYPLTQIATAVTWWWETLAPLLLVVYWLRYTADRGGRLRNFVLRYDPRLLFAAVGVTLHLTILATVNVGPFSWVSLSYYLCLIPPRPSIR
jgi:hypothetical protein